MTSVDMHACCCRKSPHNLPAAKCAISIIAQGLDGDIWPEHPSSLLPPSNESRQPPDFWKIRFFWLIIVIFIFFLLSFQRHNASDEGGKSGEGKEEEEGEEVEEG